MTTISERALRAHLQHIKISARQTLELVSALEERLPMSAGVLADDTPIQTLWLLAVDQIPQFDKHATRILGCLQSGLEPPRKLNTVGDLRSLLKEFGSPVGKKWSAREVKDWTRIPEFGERTYYMFRTLVETFLS